MPGHPRLPCYRVVKTWMPGTSPGMTSFLFGGITHNWRALGRGSGVLFLESVVEFEPMVDQVEAGIDQFALHQEQRRLVVELEVAERVGQDLGHPDQAGLDVADEEQVHGAVSYTHLTLPTIYSV